MTSFFASTALPIEKTYFSPLIHYIPPGRRRVETVVHDARRKRLQHPRHVSSIIRWKMERKTVAILLHILRRQLFHVQPYSSLSAPSTHQ